MVFDRGVFTPNDQFYLRWDWSDIPLEVEAQKFRLEIGADVRQAQSLGLDELLRVPRLSYAAVNQCSGNSRGFFQPRVPGAQWAHGAMGNASREGVSLRTVLDRAASPRGRPRSASSAWIARSPMSIPSGNRWRSIILAMAR